VIVTGTPTGIGYTQHPPVLLQDGDNMTVSIEHIGSLTDFVQRSRN
jgi:2-keto-4-pentenoate hydratase/2-oxohepta-3-ene-1,7-dioic acid hydratase in catechol pathway